MQLKSDFDESTKQHQEDMAREHTKLEVSPPFSYYFVSCDCLHDEVWCRPVDRLSNLPNYNSRLARPGSVGSLTMILGHITLMQVIPDVVLLFFMHGMELAAVLRYATTAG